MARRVFITVAEVSGDRHAAQLIRSLRQIEPDLVIEGHGGPEMEAAGATIHRNTVTRAAMGWRGILRAGEVYSILRWTRRYFQEYKPDLQIGVDSPSMNIHFAKAAHGMGIPTLQYVAPQLWAWAAWRMHKYRRWVDRVACILPFEEAYFRRHGVNAKFVGHPLFDELPAHRTTEREHYMKGRPPVIGLLPGSRRSEAEQNFPHMLNVAGRLRKAFPGVRFLVPTTAATHPVVKRELAKDRERSKNAIVRRIARDAATDGSQRDTGVPPVPVASEVGKFRITEALPTQHGRDARVTTVGSDLADGEAAIGATSASAEADPTRACTQHSPSSDIKCAQDAFDDMVPRCDLCLTVSGTATLHVAGFGVPMIVVYRINPITWNAAGRWIVRTRTFALVNVLGKGTNADAATAAGGHIVPEFVPWHGSIDRVADLVIEMLRNPDQLREQRQRLSQMIGLLDRPGASMNVARLAIDMMNESATALISASTK
jgi:lipid A disaccharide synthetase